MSVLALLLALLLSLSSAAARGEPAPVYPAAAAQGSTAAFIGADGLGRPALRRREIEALFGAPESVALADGADSGGTLVLHYPSRGLQFQFDPRHASEVNPPVGWVVASLPFAERTPQGLYLGMPQEDALPILRALYRKRYQIALSYDHGQVRGETWGGRNQGWRETQSASFDFRAGRLHKMSFQIEPTPLVPPGTPRRLLAWGLMLAVLALLVAGMAALRRRLAPWREQIRATLGALLALAGVVGVVIAAILLGGGDGYGRLAGLVLGAGALGLVVLALLAFAGSARPAVSRPAIVVLAVLFLGALVARLF